MFVPLWDVKHNVLPDHQASRSSLFSFTSFLFVLPFLLKFVCLVCCLQIQRSLLFSAADNYGRVVPDGQQHNLPGGKNVTPSNTHTTPFVPVSDGLMSTFQCPASQTNDIESDVSNKEQRHKSQFALQLLPTFWMMRLPLSLSHRVCVFRLPSKVKNGSLLVWTRREKPVLHRKLSPVNHRHTLPRVPR